MQTQVLGAPLGTLCKMPGMGLVPGNLNRVVSLELAFFLVSVSDCVGMNVRNILSLNRIKYNMLY